MNINLGFESFVYNGFPTDECYSVRPHERNFLEVVGVSILTGEACAYSMRLLCDLNEEGAALVAEFLGTAGKLNLPRNMNSKVNGKPAIRSIMLTRGMINELKTWACLTRVFDAGVVLIVVNHNSKSDPSYIACPSYDAARDAYDKLSLRGNTDSFQQYSSLPAGGQPSSHGRNQHAWSGRYE